MRLNSDQHMANNVMHMIKSTKDKSRFAITDGTDHLIVTVQRLENDNGRCQETIEFDMFKEQDKND